MQLALLPIAGCQETSERGIDLMIVDTAGLAELIPSLPRAEQALSRPANPQTPDVDMFSSAANISRTSLTASGSAGWISGS